MLKLVICGALFVTISTAPLETTNADKSSSDHHHVQSLLLRPSPINPDVRTDPKPPERIILDDTKSERDFPSEKDSHENLQEHRDGRKDNNKHHGNEQSNDEHHNAKANEHHDEHSDKHDNHKQDSHDQKRDTDGKVLSTEKLKSKDTILQPSTSGEPTIEYPTKIDEKSIGFETSHRIPNVLDSERTFETSHHIPSHIEDERKKLVENQSLKTVT